MHENKTDFSGEVTIKESLNAIINQHFENELLEHHLDKNIDAYGEEWQRDREGEREKGIFPSQYLIITA